MHLYIDFVEIPGGFEPRITWVIAPALHRGPIGAINTDVAILFLYNNCIHLIKIITR